MNINFQDIVNDLISKPGLGMFAWMCFIFFVIALIFFVWAIRSGQFEDLEQTKFDIFDEDEKKEVNSNG